MEDDKKFEFSVDCSGSQDDSWRTEAAVSVFKSFWTLLRFLERSYQLNREEDPAFNTDIFEKMMGSIEEYLQQESIESRRGSW